MRNDNFFVVQGWMVNELDLTGNELMVYAIIYGFSQEPNSWYEGSLSYLSSFINCKSKTTAFNTLKELVDKGYIEKQEYEINNVKFCKYRTVYKNLIYPISKNDTNNNIINNNKENNISKDILSKKVFKKPSVEEIQEYCTERNNNINAEAFYDFYESKNWYIGKNKMKDWKAAVRTWEKNNKKTSVNSKQRVVPEWFRKEIDSTDNETIDKEWNDFIEEFRR